MLSFFRVVNRTSKLFLFPQTLRSLVIIFHVQFENSLFLRLRVLRMKYLMRAGDYVFRFKFSLSIAIACASFRNSWFSILTHIVYYVLSIAKNPKNPLENTFSSVLVKRAKGASSISLSFCDNRIENRFYCIPFLFIRWMNVTFSAAKMQSSVDFFCHMTM